MKSNIKLTGIMLITVAMIIGLTPFVNNMQIYPSANAFDMDEIQISCILNSCNEDNSASSTNIDDDSITCTCGTGNRRRR